MYNKEITLLKGLKCGYLQFRDHSHPLAYSDGSVYYHRHLASLSMGRWLETRDHVHHRDENKLNNTVSNLQVLTASEHAKIHNPTTEFGPDSRCLEEYVCINCGNIFHPLYASIVKKYCSDLCSHQSRIRNKELTKELLDELIPLHTWGALGLMFDYSDVGIRKRAKALGCNIPNRRPSRK